MNATRNIGNETIACVVLNWNGGDNVMNCIRSLLTSQGINANILVIDNGSTDGSDTRLRATFPQLTLLKNDRNVGVAKAWNMGVRWAMDRGNPCIFFLNDDAVVGPTCLMTLARTLVENPSVGIVTPRILDGKNSGRIWFDGGFVNMFGAMVHRGFANEPVAVHEPFTEDFATGCAMLVRAEVFKQAGLFDESYFAYSEDADLCVRARAKDLAIMHHAGAVATHYPSTATIKNKGKWFRDYYVTRNSLMLGQRQWSGMRRVIFFSYSYLVGVFVPIIYFVVTGQFRRVVAVTRGVIDYVLGKDGRRYD